MKKLEFNVPGLETGAAGAGCAGTHISLDSEDNRQSLKLITYVDGRP
jgi:hypothetical protein